jgi:DNA-binding CsgD family transcriptional regulator
LKFTFDLRVRKPQGIYIRILQQSVFLELTDNGAPLLDFSTVTDITPFKKDNRLTLAVYKLSSNYQHQLIHQEDFFHSNLVFTRRQLEILELVARGLTSKQIAAELYLSIETVKNHRKKILEVSGAKNIAEAVKIAFG